MKSLKTPLRYPGGKSRACTKMDQYFPDLRNYNEYREPFLGGGSVALHVTKKYPDIKIWVNDLYEPLVNFWIQLRDNSREIKRQLQELKQRHPDPTSAKKLFLDAKEYLSGSQTTIQFPPYTENIWRAVSSQQMICNCFLSSCFSLTFKMTTGHVKLGQCATYHRGAICFIYIYMIGVVYTAIFIFGFVQFKVFILIFSTLCGYFFFGFEG